MVIMFDASEIFQLAIRIEENGEKFYTRMSEKFADSELKKLFTYLAQEEVGHQKVYQEILSSFESYEPHESYPGEYFSYLRSYADNIIFSQKEFDKRINEIETPLAAIEFAIGAELNSILYYQEVKKMVSDKSHQKIESIIDEERKHFVQLSEIKKDIDY
jgi:rubrerythrin